MQADVIISIAIAAAVVLIVSQFARVLRAMMLHRTVRRGIMEGAALTPELLERIGEEKPAQGFGDDRIGIVLIALGLALLGYGLIAGGSDGDVREAAGMSLFPLLVGAALLGRHLVIRRARAGA